MQSPKSVASITPPAQLSQNQVIISSKKETENKDQTEKDANSQIGDKTQTLDEKKPDEQVI